MRVISQDRNVDIDYNNSSFIIVKDDTKGYKIVCNGVNIAGVTIGCYETHKRAAEVLLELSKKNSAKLFLIKQDEKQMVLTDEIDAKMDVAFKPIEVTVLPSQESSVYYFPEK